jgi:hypothetical protein
MAHTVSRWLLTDETWVRARVRPCGICGGQSGTEIDIVLVIILLIKIKIN